MNASADSNVLVRLFARDDAAQLRRATELLESLEAAGASLFVPQIVLCELIWVLTRSYRFDRLRIADVISTLFATQGVAIEDADDVRAALSAYQVGRGDFADYLVRERSRRAGVLPVATFDEIVTNEEGFAGPADWRKLGERGVGEPRPGYGRRRARRATRKR